MRKAVGTCPSEAYKPWLSSGRCAVDTVTSQCHRTTFNFHGSLRRVPSNSTHQILTQVTNPQVPE